MAAGFSQEAFADHVGYARSYMSRVERGSGNPSLDAIEAFAAALNVPVQQLFAPSNTGGKRPHNVRREKG
jgi:transcriptional regulator with XRE-family HTH domain